MSGWVLVTAYLALGSAEPFMQHKLYDEKAKCQTHAAQYVKQARVGQSRTFCFQVKGQSWPFK